MATKGIVCHLRGALSLRPICEIGTVCERHGVTCGHTSLASAKRAKKILKDGGFRARIFKGFCPSYSTAKED